MEVQFCTFRRGDQVISGVVVDEQRRQTLSVVVTCTFQYPAMPNGMPSDLKAIYKTEEALEHALVGERAFHVGHVLGGGWCRVVFYAPRPVPSSIEVKLGLFKKTKLTLESRPDPEWTVYENELKPTPVEQAIEKSRPLFKVLESHGDVATSVRKVDFAALFASEQGRAEFCAAVPLVDPAFVIGNQWTDDARGHWVELHREMTTEEQAIGQACATLMELAAKHNGEFDGWACPVAQK